MVVIVTFFVTSADSATCVLGSLSSGGADPARGVTVAWGLLISACAAVLLLAGGLEAVQTASIIAAFPFLLVLVAAAVSLFLALRQEGTPAGNAASVLAGRPAAAEGAGTDPYPDGAPRLTTPPADLHVPLRGTGREDAGAR